MPPATFRQWEIWLVDWKHEDCTSKPRPALLASSAAYAAEKSLVWAMKITATPGLDSAVVALDPTVPGWTAMGLSKPCFLYVAKIQTIPTAALFRKYGEVTTELAARVLELMKSVTGMSIP